MGQFDLQQEPLPARHPDWGDQRRRAVRSFAKPVGLLFSFPKPGDYNHLRSWWHNVRDLPRDWWDEIRFFYQRGRYGYSERDWWSLDHYLMSWLPEAIRKYKWSMGFPGDDILPQHLRAGIRDEEELEAQAVAYWHGLLEQMASGFEQGAAWCSLDNHRDFYQNVTDEELARAQRRKWEGESVSERPGVRRLLTDEEVGLEFDQEGWDALQAQRRRNYINGFRLFRKYFLALWD